MSLRFTRTVWIATSLACAPISTCNAEWFETAGHKINNVSQEACDLMRSGITKWFKQQKPWSIAGSAGKGFYARMSSASRNAVTGGAPSGAKIIDSYTLKTGDGAALSQSYSRVAQTKVPYLVQVGATPLPPA